MIFHLIYLQKTQKAVKMVIRCIQRVIRGSRSRVEYVRVIMDE